MKNLLLILTVLLSVNGIAQNRFEKNFIIADSIFDKAIREAALKTDKELGIKYQVPDSTLYEALWSVIESDTTKFETTIMETMQVYFVGYLKGLENSGEVDECDMYQFLTDLVAEKKALMSWIRFKRKNKVINQY